MSAPHHILLTGAGRLGQIGESVARELAARGHRLILVDRDDALARDRAADLGALGFRAEWAAADLTDPAAVDAMAVRVRGLCGGSLAAVVHAAGGFAMSGPVAESDLALWQHMHSINLTTAYLVTRAMVPLVRRARGAFVYFGSAAVLPGGHGARMAGYAAAKAGVLALMRAVAEEERAVGVRANAIAPTAVRTAANLADMGDGARYVEREEVARTVAWLCSDESRPLTGEVLKLGA